MDNTIAMVTCYSPTINCSFPSIW